MTMSVSSSMGAGKLACMVGVMLSGTANSASPALIDAGLRNVSPIHQTNAYPERIAGNIPKVGNTSFSAYDKWRTQLINIDPRRSSLYKTTTPIRDTSEHEYAIASLREWASLEEDWDGEGAAAPNLASLKAAERFVSLLMSTFSAPEMMLHANGVAGMMWEFDGLYGEIEFLSGDRLAYFFKSGENKHKGEMKFDGKSFPSALKAFIPTAHGA